MSNAVTKRIQIELSESSMKKVENLRKNTDLKTTVDVIRMGLAVLDVIQQKKSEGYVMQFKKGEETVEIILPIF